MPLVSPQKQGYNCCRNAWTASKGYYWLALPGERAMEGSICWLKN